MAQRLTSKHPHHEKFDRVLAAMEAEGIRMEFLGFRTLVEIDGVTYDLEDREGGADSPMTSFPPPCEFRLVLGR